MSRFTDPEYLKTVQYRDASNLNARMEIHRCFSTNPYGWFPWVFDTLLDSPGPARVLELGCGPGTLWEKCAMRIPSEWEITLSDLSEGMLAAARENLSKVHREFEFRQIDAQSIPFGDASLDLVVADHMLYHLPNRPKALAEIHRVLRTGGCLVASTIGNKHLKELNEWFGRVGLTDTFRPMGANRFTLENGLEQLTPFFSNVKIKRYQDNLSITETQPLMAYIHSSSRAEDIPETTLVQLQQIMEDQLRERGMIFVTKDSGLFEAIKGEN